MRAMPRPAATARLHDRLKLHRRRLRLDDREHTVITLRPGTAARFSTNYFHGTWHVLSDWHGAQLLGRLLWGLAYQRVPGTLVLIDRPFLDRNPFDAEPGAAIVLVPAPLTTFGVKAARELRRHLPLRGPGVGTVRWQTHGLDGAVAARRAARDRHRGEARAPWVTPRGFQERMGELGGLITFAAVPEVLKRYATEISTPGDFSYHGVDYTEIDWPNGEIQVFHDYDRRVSAAVRARREILAEVRPAPSRDLLNPLIWARATEIRHRARTRLTP